MSAKNIFMITPNGLFCPEKSASVLNKSINQSPSKFEKPEPQKNDCQRKNRSEPSLSVKGSGGNSKPVTSQKRTTPKYRNGLHRSHSTRTPAERDVTKPSGRSEEKKSIGRADGNIIKSNYVDKTPVSHFSTPRRSVGWTGSGGSNTRQGDKQTNFRMKKFFSEANLSKPPVTPECFSKVQMDTPHSKQDSEELSPHLDVETSNLTVGVRVRPLNSREKSDPTITQVVSVDGCEVKVQCESGVSHSFTYDHCFWSCDPHHQEFASQDVVFSTMVQPLVENAFQGYNACLFAYGQTGSGKSYSMMGLDVDGGNLIGNEAGIIPRFCHELFERIASLSDTKVSRLSNMKITVEISYFEIYNEKIHDLLGGSTESGRRAALRVREHPIYGPYVVDLSTHGVVSYEDLQGWLLVGNSQRATAATGMNEKSSRSHSIFSVILTQIQDEKIMEEHHVSNLRSKISLVDLAGSERLSQTCASGDRLREGVSINRSLLTLGKVISALADNTSTKKKAFVPYRDSVLTWLLRESLGGNSRTTMLATISPASSHIEETLATLRYACQVRTIVNKVHINEDPHDRLIRDLRAEVERLRALREEYERQKKFAVPRRLVDNEMMSEIRSKELEIDKLKDQLKQSEEHLSRTHKSWSERLQEAEKCKSAEMNYLRHCGLAVQLNWDQQQPCLVNLNADPILSGTLLYLLPPGTVLVGRQNQDADIALSGPLVNNKHCFIKNEGGKLSLTPVGEGQTFINGKAVSGVVDLHHGDRLVIGGNHFFRVNNPQDQDADTFTQPADYHYAYQEIHEVQENKLREELEEAAKRALKELEQTREEAEKQLGTQRLLYEQQLKHLGSALDQQKDELNEIQKKKEELELQKQVLEAEVESHKTWRNCGQFHDSSFNISPYQSNFLKEIEDALNETICETENILRTSPMTPECCSIGLHDMKVMVQEANQRCKELCIDYEFSRQHRVGQSSLEQTVRVRNRGKCWVAYWKPSYFLQWLERLRLHDPDDSLKELLDVEDEDYWEEDPEDSSSEEDNSLISTKQIKRQLNETIHHLSLESSCIGSELGSPYNNTADNANSIDSSDVEADNYEEMNSCVQQIEEASNKLRKLCEENEVGDVKHTLDALDNMVKQLRTTLHLNSESVLDYDEHHAFKIPDMHTTPNKSNLRSPCLTGVDTPKMHKVVRFQFSDSQRENLKN